MTNRNKSWWYVAAILFPLIGMMLFVMWWGSGESEKKSIAVRFLCLSFVGMLLWA